MPFYSYGYRLLVGAWIGAILCFGALVAPALFQAFTPEQAGTVVRQIIPRLDLYALIAGPLAIVLAWAVEGRPASRGAFVRVGLLALMTVLAAVSYFVLSPTMEALREGAGGSISSLAPGDPARRRFGMLHGVSTMLMLGELAFGLVALALLPQRRGVTPATRS